MPALEPRGGVRTFRAVRTLCANCLLTFARDGGKLIASAQNNAETWLATTPLGSSGGKFVWFESGCQLRG